MWMTILTGLDMVDLLECAGCDFAQRAEVYDRRGLFVELASAAVAAVLDGVAGLAFDHADFRHRNLALGAVHWTPLNKVHSSQPSERPMTIAPTVANSHCLAVFMV